MCWCGIKYKLSTLDTKGTDVHASFFLLNYTCVEAIIALHFVIRRKEHWIEVSTKVVCFAIQL